MNLESRIKDRLNKLVDRQNLMEFPELLKRLRLAYGQSRRNVCTDLKFSEMRMFCLENGTFRRPIMLKEIETLANYYNFDRALMKSKADSFITNGYGKPQSNKVRN